MAPARWCTAVCASVAGTGQAPRRYTLRQQLWSRLLEEWQTVFWAVLATQPVTADASWVVLAEHVRDGGAILTAQVATVGAIERSHATQIAAAAAMLVDELAPGSRRTVHRRSGGSAPHRGHRAKILLDAGTHARLAERAARDGWALADLTGAITATAAVLAVSDSRAAAEVRLLRECVEVVTAAAATARQLYVAPAAPDLSRELAALLHQTRVSIDQALATRGESPASVDVRRVLPEVFVVLGWPQPWQRPAS
jgi:hypothetical protein